MKHVAVEEILSDKEYLLTRLARDFESVLSTISNLYAQCSYLHLLSEHSSLVQVFAPVLSEDGRGVLHVPFGHPRVEVWVIAFPTD